MCTDNIMNSENINIEAKKYLGDINRLCVVLDFFASPTIEEKMIFSLKCYIEVMRVCIGDFPFEILFPYFKLDQLWEILNDVYKYGDEKGFSKKQGWLDFVCFINTVNVVLKNAIKKETEALGLAAEDCMMNSENIHTIMPFNIIRCLCENLDRLVSPNIEKEVTCDLGCYATIDSIVFIDNLMSSTDEFQSIIGSTELTILPQLRKTLCDISIHHYYDEEQGYEENGYKKGFFKEQRWLDFVTLVNTVNTLLKDAIKRYQEKQVKVI